MLQIDVQDQILDKLNTLTVVLNNNGSIYYVSKIAQQLLGFNPDDYNKGAKNITSCWGQDGKGICVIKKSKKKEWTQRLTVLEEQIKYWINPENTTNKTIEVIQLFYDVLAPYPQ